MHASFVNLNREVHSPRAQSRKKRTSSTATGGKTKTKTKRNNGFNGENSTIRFLDDKSRKDKDDNDTSVCVSSPTIKTDRKGGKASASVPHQKTHTLGVPGPSLVRLSGDKNSDSDTYSSKSSLGLSHPFAGLTPSPHASTSQLGAGVYFKAPPSPPKTKHTTFNHHRFGQSPYSRPPSAKPKRPSPNKTREKRPSFDLFEQLDFDIDRRAVESLRALFILTSQGQNQHKREAINGGNFKIKSRAGHLTQSLSSSLKTPSRPATAPARRRSKARTARAPIAGRSYRPKNRSRLARTYVPAR